MYGEWVRDSIASNKPYDRMARERLVAQGYDGPTRHFLPYDVIGPPGETMAEEVRVLFGGVSIAPSVTTIPMKHGVRISSGAWRHSSDASSRWGIKATSTSCSIIPLMSRWGTGT